jgi:hypothetical protein
MVIAFCWEGGKNQALLPGSNAMCRHLSLPDGEAMTMGLSNGE